MQPAVVLLLLIGLTGCTSSEQRDQIAEQHEIAECTKLEFTPGTAEFSNCRLQIRALAGQKKANAIAAFGVIQQIQANQQK